ncbi:MAG: HAMP domain-containing histidine kinase [Bacteroidia bacterium]|nr:HAMP domain-containing histidine kinase [Bacteroidia bacterium]MDW8346660.1 HAMP domain-containing sensor histidine kinase [Bacteroidia bacterium]
MNELSYLQIIIDEKKQRKRKFIHYFSLAGIITTLLSAIFGFFYDIRLGINIALSLCIIMSIMFLINLKIYREEIIEAYIICLNIGIGIGVWLVGREAFMSIFYTSMFLAIGLLMDSKSYLKILFHFGFTIFFAFLTYYVELPLHNIEKPAPQQANILKNMNFVLCSLLNIFFVWEMIKMTRETENKLINFATELQSHNKILKDLNAELDQFAYRVSHDLRAPISSTLGLVYLAKEEHELKNLQEYFQMMEKSLIKLDDFIQEILIHTRNSRLPVVYEPLENIQQFIQETAQPFVQNPSFKHIQFTLVIQENTILYTDKTRLKMVLQNLLSNAFYYHDPQKPKCWIKLTIQIDPDKVKIEISDNGIGIEEKHLNKIFEMFYRGTEKAPGTGLGLYIVKQVLEKLEGEIFVRSTYMQGTTFIIEFPNRTNKKGSEKE